MNAKLSLDDELAASLQEFLWLPAIEELMRTEVSQSQNSFSLES